MGVHHAWGRTYKDAYQRYLAMTGHELRYQNGFDCQGLWVEVEVEKELKLRPSAISKTSFPAIRSPASTTSSTMQGARRQVRQDPDRAIDPPWLLDGLGPRGGLGKAARRAPQLLHDVGGEQLHDLELSQEMPRARPDLSRLRRHALVPALRRRHQPDGDERRLSHRRPPGRFRPLPAARTARREPAGLDDDSLDADQQCRRRRQSGADLPQGQARATRSITSAKAPSRPSRKEEEFKNKAEWVEGVPKLKSLEQIFKEKKGGFEIRGRSQRRRHGRLGLRRALRRIARPASRLRLSRRAGHGRRTSRSWAPAHVRRDRLIASSPGRMSAKPRAPASSTSPRAAARKTSAWARQSACRRSRR